MKFKNIVTGNIVSTENRIAVDLMKRSDRYTPVNGKNTKVKNQKTE